MNSFIYCKDFDAGPQSRRHRQLRSGNKKRWEKSKTAIHAPSHCMPITRIASKNYRKYFASGFIAPRSEAECIWRTCRVGDQVRRSAASFDADRGGGGDWRRLGGRCVISEGRAEPRLRMSKVNGKPLFLSVNTKNGVGEPCNCQTALKRFTRRHRNNDVTERAYNVIW